jgi:CMP-N,N'-diacetyllegionaminic acid synthase
MKKSNKKIWVIIPARSGSKGIKNKNIVNFLGLPLIYHSINFAKKLKNIEKILVSTDSNRIKKLCLKAKVFIPFLRSKKASSDEAMEEDILEDIRIKCKKNKIDLPLGVLWLRPTHPLRDLRVFQKAINLFIKCMKTILITTQTDSRIFINKSGKFIPVNNLFYKKSMLRRQEVCPAYKIFHGELFLFPDRYNKKFLGSKFINIEQPIDCKLDIDTFEDLKIGEFSFKVNRKKLQKYVHLS